MSNYSGKRICQVIELRQQHKDEYFEIHKNVWPSVLDGLERAHIVDYSINFLPVPFYRSTDPEIAGLLVATFKYIGSDFEGDMKKAGEDPETRRWWKLTDPMQKSLIDGAGGSGTGPWWYDIKEVFRFDP